MLTLMYQKHVFPSGISSSRLLQFTIWILRQLSFNNFNNFGLVRRMLSLRPEVCKVIHLIITFQLVQRAHVCSGNREGKGTLCWGSPALKTMRHVLWNNSLGISQVEKALAAYKLSSLPGGTIQINLKAFLETCLMCLIDRNFGNLLKQLTDNPYPLEMCHLTKQIKKNR